jgi:hypothetical protein
MSIAGLLYRKPASVATAARVKYMIKRTLYAAWHATKNAA